MKRISQRKGPGLASNRRCAFLRPSALETRIDLGSSIETTERTAFDTPTYGTLKGGRSLRRCSDRKSYREISKAIDWLTVKYVERFELDALASIENMSLSTFLRHFKAITNMSWLIEKGFGWLKQTGPLRQVKLRGLKKVDWLFVFSCAAHNLIRLPRLMAQPPEMLREQCA
jgi:Transposase DDE domain